MKVINWNVKWAKPGSDRANIILDKIDKLQPDIVCITECYNDIFSDIGYSISSDSDYGYQSNSDRRKVILWSKNPWTQVDPIGDKNLPSGRFISGVTKTPIGEIIFVGVCIPWRDAHVRTGRKDRQMWEDHKIYLKGLKGILNSSSVEPTILLGDFNQRVPRLKQPIFIFNTLMATIPDSLSFATPGVIPGIDKQTIDHVAHSPELTPFNLDSIDNLDYRNRELSDHFGVVIDFEKR